MLAIMQVVKSSLITSQFRALLQGLYYTHPQLRNTMILEAILRFSGYLTGPRIGFFNGNVTETSF